MEFIGFLLKAIGGILIITIALMIGMIIDKKVDDEEYTKTYEKKKK